MTSGISIGPPIYLGGGLQVGGDQVGGGPQAGGGIAVPAAAVPMALDDLTDVAGAADAPTDVPLALRKGADGVIRPEPATGPADIDWFVGQGPPGIVVGAALGDMYVDEITGTLYKLG